MCRHTCAPERLFENAAIREAWALTFRRPAWLAAALTGAGDASWDRAFVAAVARKE
jgi:hypothetical protein